MIFAILAYLDQAKVTFLKHTISRRSLLLFENDQNMNSLFVINELIVKNYIVIFFSYDFLTLISSSRHSLLWLFHPISWAADSSMSFISPSKSFWAHMLYFTIFHIWDFLYLSFSYAVIFMWVEKYAALSIPSSLQTWLLLMHSG